MPSTICNEKNTALQTAMNILPSGDHFSDEFDQQQMWKEVDGFVLSKYGPVAAQTVKFQYTNWKNEHRPYHNTSDDFMDKYDRAEVRKMY